MAPEKKQLQLQPRFWQMGFTCPYHDNRVGLITIEPGLLECRGCRRVFTQRPTGLSFVITGGPGEE